MTNTKTAPYFNFRFTLVLSVYINNQYKNTTLSQLQVHPETFTLDLSMYIKLAWADNRIQLSNGSVNVDQSFMNLVNRRPIDSNI